ncbi:MAG TPA: phosphonate ABC transporter ATP-binding protein [Nitratifractor sp.]|nr:phosphonate ABC transporter ATP-binding protein [Nitratifractor sp.]HHH20866.1 phosphonate ABC transporter ATP-binding protein [Nitratifractor sp.]
MVKMKNLTLGYKKEKILKKIDFKVSKGEFIGIIGPSGAGKSTLMFSLVGGIKVFDGEFEVLGHDMRDIKKKNLRKVREEIGFIFQGYNIVNRLNVVDNIVSGMISDVPVARAIIKYYKEKELKEVEKLLELVNMGKHALKRCDELSGGQRQRVAIARALASQPEIILADEPISALDQKSAKKVMDILKKVNEELNVTIISNLHHIDVAKNYCTRIIGINSGHIVFDGKSDELTDEIIDKIYEGEKREESDEEE